VIYSTGPDQIDNGGKLDHGMPPRFGTDVGYRLWDPARRRQPAPKPNAVPVPPQGVR
jgi:hypothetical protein